MGLIITLEPDAGTDSFFFVGETKVSLKDMSHSQRFRLAVHTAAQTMVYEVTSNKSVEILPNVRVSAGDNARAHQCKAVVEAPPAVKINRGKYGRG